MNNLGAYEKLFELYSNDIQNNTKLIIVLSIFIIINLIVTILNIISANRIKNKEKKIFSYNIKETKRIDIYEKLYHLVENLTNIDSIHNDEILLDEMRKIEQYVSKNNLYISKNIKNCTNEILDYFKSVLINIKLKDYKLEFSLLDKYSKIFNS